MTNTKELNKSYIGVRRDILDIMSEDLLEKETLDATQFAAIFTDGGATGDELSEEISPQDASSQDDSDTPPRPVPPSAAPLPA